MRRLVNVGRPRRRLGQLIPMVAVILILFAFLAFSYMFQSQSTTSITGIAIYGMKAHQAALAFADEAMLVVQRNFDDLGGSPAWKDELLGQLDGAEDGAPIVVDKGDIRGELPGAMEVLNSIGNAELTFLDVRLHGFHRLHYAATDLYDAPTSFYHNEFLDPDESNRQPVQDWIGYVTVQARVSVRGIERQVQVTRDLKVVDVQPPAREFTLFNWMAVTPEQRSFGLSLFSLNQGGDMALWNQGVGRVLIRGPYAIVAEGDPDGTGGERRGGEMRENYSYPAGGDSWNGFSVIPGRRALVWNQVAMPWGSNIRPDDDGVNFAFRARCPTKDFVSIDSDTSVADCPSQEYMCGATDVGKQTFSIWGRPGRDVAGLPPDLAGERFSMFRGLRVDFENGGQAIGAYEDGPSLPGGDDGDGITVEGLGLVGIFNRAVFDNVFGIYLCPSITYAPPPVFVSCFFLDTYTGWAFLGGKCVFGCPAMLPCGGGMTWTLAASPPLEPSTFNGAGNGYPTTAYALRGWEEEPANIWASLIGAALSFVLAQDGPTSLGGAETAGTDAAADTAADTAADAAADTAADTATDAATSAAYEGVTAGAFFSGFSWEGFSDVMGEAIMDSVMTNQAMSLAGGNSGPMVGAAELAEAAPMGLFPPKYRNYMRGATRIHRTLEEAKPFGQDVLNLDGVVLVENFPTDEPQSFSYRGKGILMTATEGTVNVNPFLGNITPEDPAEDWMTFAHVVQREAQPDGGDAQVQIEANELTLSLYAPEGVTATADSVLFGNLVTAWINKWRIPEGTKFDVVYNVERLAPSRFGGPDESEWTGSKWKRVSVSPKWSGYYDRYR